MRSAGILEQLLQLGGPGAFSAEVNTTIPRLLGDFSLNVANALSACTYLKSGLDRITPTHDCNADQIIDIQSLLQTDRLEVILHQHLAIFHTEHCVFCRFLSAGNNYTDCGHPCERNHVELRSMEGQVWVQGSYRVNDLYCIVFRVTLIISLMYSDCAGSPGPCRPRLPQYSF